MLMGRRRLHRRPHTRPNWTDQSARHQSLQVVFGFGAENPRPRPVIDERHRLCVSVFRIQMLSNSALKWIHTVGCDARNDSSTIKIHRPSCCR
jgi:hypothetical protein